MWTLVVKRWSGKCSIANIGSINSLTRSFSLSRDKCTALCLSEIRHNGSSTHEKTFCFNGIDFDFKLNILGKVDVVRQCCFVGLDGVIRRNKYSNKLCYFIIMRSRVLVRQRTNLRVHNLNTVIWNSKAWERKEQRARQSCSYFNIDQL